MTARLTDEQVGGYADKTTDGKMPLAEWVRQQDITIDKLRAACGRYEAALQRRDAVPKMAGEW